MNSSYFSSLLPSIRLQKSLGSLIIACGVAFASYRVFFYFAPAIWTYTRSPPLSEFNPWIRMWLNERDGMEVYALYALSLLNVAIIFGLSKLVPLIQIKLLQMTTILILTVFTVLYFLNIGLHPPVTQPGDFAVALWVISGVVGLTVLLSTALLRWEPWVLAILFFIIFVACFIPSGLVFTDYIYIFMPALRLMNGFALNESYFQYDYLLSLLALAWMKLQLPVHSFLLLNNLSYVALLAGTYGFARIYFLDKRLALYLLVALTIIKVYGNIIPFSYLPQVTPIRLDWWLPILAVSYWKGPQSWQLGALLGLLMFLHHAFGTIYVTSYILFTLAILLVEFTDRQLPVKLLIQKHMGLYGLNYLIILAAFGIYTLYSQGNAPPAALMYQKYGIGFLPISTKSFFWYILVEINLLVWLTLKSRVLLSWKYFQTTFFLIFLLIGNLLYFFGRSHENNIINISASIALAGFVTLDILSREWNETKEATSKRKYKWPIHCLAIGIIAAISYCYSGRMQWPDVTKALHIYTESFKPAIPLNLDELKKITNESPKILFLAEDDFVYYYYGGYVPQNYFSFLYSWVMLEEYRTFLTDKLAEGYYLVIPLQELPKFTEVIQPLIASRIFQNKDYLILSNLPAEK